MNLIKELVKSLSDRLSSIECQTIPPDATLSTELASNKVINFISNCISLSQYSFMKD